MDIGTALLGLAIGLITYWYYCLKVKYRSFNSLKGPTPLPIVGNAHEISSPKAVLPTFMKWQEKYGGIVKTWIGFGPPMLLISDYKFLEHLLSSNFIINKSEDYKFLARWLGTGLLTGGGAKWRKHRKLLTPAFHLKILEQFPSIYDSASNILVNKLLQEVDKTSFNVYPFITLCSLDIICETSLGSSINAQLNSESEYVYSVKEMCRIIIDRSISLFKMHDFFYYFSKDYQKERTALKILHKYTNSIIKKRQSEIEKDQENSQILHEFGSKRRATLLDLLLYHKMNGENLTDDDIRQEVDTFMFEGHDTIASAISFALFSIAENPHVQKNLLEELHAIFDGDSNRSATYEDLQKMKYLEAVIKETLRLYPSVPIYARNVHEATTLCDIFMKTEVTLAIFAYGIHRNPELYPNPEQFDPERFMDKSTVVSPYAYIPFSAGPRNCIGQKFAMFEMKSVISKVLRKFEVFPASPKHELVLVAETVLKSASGIHISLKERQSV